MELDFDSPQIIRVNLLALLSDNHSGLGALDKRLWGLTRRTIWFAGRHRGETAGEKLFPFCGAAGFIAGNAAVTRNPRDQIFALLILARMSFEFEFRPGANPPRSGLP